MRRVGDELAQPGLECLLLVEHQIEGPGQTAGFGPWPGRGHPAGAVASHDSVGDPGDLGDRTEAETADP